MASLAQEGNAQVALGKMTASVGAFLLATFFKLFIAGIARIFQFFFVLKSILAQCTILF